MTRPRGIAACGHSATARAAATIVEEGGNAFDAALAAMCAACVVEPVLASLGGGGFLLARPIDGRLAGKAVVYDFFPQTPRRRRPEAELDFQPIVADFGTARQEFHIGIGAAATPGAVKGLFTAHGDLGRMPLRRVVEPAVMLARDGVRVDALQAYLFRLAGAILSSTEACRRLYQSRDNPGEFLRDGETLRLAELADTLEILVIEGEDLFYRGEIASRIVADCAALGGHLTLQDLGHYRVERRHPLAIDAFGARLLLNPPPSSGGILIAFAMAILAQAGMEGLDWGSRAYIARLAQVMEMTNRVRLEARLHELGTETASAALLDPGLIRTYRSQVLGRPQAARGTTHISVIDADGNAAALSLTNGEGCGYVVPATAIVLNNVLGEEDINPHGFHRWPPDQRLSSMMAPTLVLAEDGSLTVMGSGGSNRIRTAILQVLLNLLAFGMPVEDAVRRPRLHFERDRLNIEPGFPEAALQGLEEEFEDVLRWQETNLFFGGVHTVRADRRGAISGAGDPRRGGVALAV